MHENSNDAENQIISVICPTRGRPSRLKTMMNSALETASKPENVEFCIWIDKDDSTYDEMIVKNEFKNLRVLRGPRFSLSTMYNNLLVISKGSYLLWGGDDVEFRTSGWDTQIISEIDKFENKIGLVYVNDLGNYEQKYANVGAVHVNWVNTLGFVFTPHLKDNGVDGWITDVARQIDRCKYLETVHIEHMQHRQGKAELDKTYSDRDNSHKWYDPFDLYHLLKDERRRDALYLASQWPNLEVTFKSRYFLANIYIWLKQKFSNIHPLRVVYFGSISNKMFIMRAINKITFKNRRKWDS